jgi:hypothetical protein
MRAYRHVTVWSDVIADHPPRGLEVLAPPGESRQLDDVLTLNAATMPLALRRKDDGTFGLVCFKVGHASCVS